MKLPLFFTYISLLFLINACQNDIVKNSKNDVENDILSTTVSLADLGYKEVDFFITTIQLLDENRKLINQKKFDLPNIRVDDSYIVSALRDSLQRRRMVELLDTRVGLTDDAEKKTNIPIKRVAYICLEGSKGERLIVPDSGLVLEGMTKKINIRVSQAYSEDVYPIDCHIDVAKIVSAGQVLNGRFQLKDKKLVYEFGTGMQAGSYKIELLNKIGTISYKKYKAMTKKTNNGIIQLQITILKDLQTEWDNGSIDSEFSHARIMVPFALRKTISAITYHYFKNLSKSINLENPKPDEMIEIANNIKASQEDLRGLVKILENIEEKSPFLGSLFEVSIFINNFLAVIATNDFIFPRTNAQKQKIEQKQADYERARTKLLDDIEKYYQTNWESRTGTSDAKHYFSTYLEGKIPNIVLVQEINNSVQNGINQIEKLGQKYERWND